MSREDVISTSYLSADVDTVEFLRLGTTPELRILAIRGDLDVSTSSLLRRELDSLLDAGIRRIELDLSGVAFMDSSALSALVSAHERARSSGLQLKLLHPSPACAKVLGITGLDRVFDLI